MNRASAVNYLREHPELLTASEKEAFDALKAEGILAPSTNRVDVHLDRILAAARAKGAMPVGVHERIAKALERIAAALESRHLDE